MFDKLVIIFVGIFCELWFVSNPDLQERGTVKKINKAVIQETSLIKNLHRYVFSPTVSEI